MDDAASFDAVLQCNLLEIFCEGLGAAIIVTDKLDQVTFASVRLLHFFSVPENAIKPGVRARDFYAALFEAGCRFGARADAPETSKEDWISERVASGWKERVDKIEQGPDGRWYHHVSRRFSSGLGLTVLHDITDHKKKEMAWLQQLERVRLTEEILDNLPIGIAIKDRNLNYAAVNQQFCDLLKVEAESFLGKSVWDVFEPITAGVIEQANWELLASGKDQKEIVEILEQDGETRQVMQRARRIGRPGSHYLVMTFEIISDAAPAKMVTRRQDKILRATPIMPPQAGSAAPHAGAALHMRVVYATTTNIDTASLGVACARAGVELCVIGKPSEFKAFIPALRDAGMSLDLVVFDHHSSTCFHDAAIAIEAPIRMVASGHDLITAIDAFRNEKNAEATYAPAPVEPAPDMAPKRLAAEPEKKDMTLDVLAIDDNAVNRLALEQMLDSLGLRYLVTETGAQALNAIAIRRPRLVFADTTLPDFKTAEFMERALEQCQALSIKIPFIAMSAPNCSESRDEFHNWGFADVAPKPLSPEAIDNMLNKHLLKQVKGKFSPKNAA